MSLFRQAVRLIFLILGVITGMTVTLALFFVRMMIRPPRQRLWANPADMGLYYEDVEFPAQDGLRLSGWFIPHGQQEKGPAVILLHGWPWNRLGSSGEGPLMDLPGSAPLDTLYLADALHNAGYHLLMFDLRNHGQSAGAGPVTFGLNEANDLLGAIDFLLEQPQVDANRIGAVGFSMGANAILYALPRSNQIRAAVAVQPTSPAIFSKNYGQFLLGPLSRLVVPLSELFYRLAGGLPLQAIEPIFAAAGGGETAVLYIQGQGDPWGSVENVAQMVAVTPAAVEPLFVDSRDRFGGYRYVIDNPAPVLDFLKEHM